MITVASVLLLVTGAVNLAGGIAAITGSHILITSARYLSGGLHAWGWVMTILSAVQLIAAAGVWAGNQLARWFAVAVVGLSAIGQMFVIPASPFWSLMIIAADAVALWGLPGLHDPTPHTRAVPQVLRRGLLYLATSGIPRGARQPSTHLTLTCTITGVGSCGW